MNSTRAVTGVILARAKQVMRKLVAGIQPQRARQPDGEKAPPLLQVRLVAGQLPAQDRSCLGNLAQIVVDIRHQLRAALKQHGDRSRGRGLVSLIPADKAQHTAPLFLRLGRQFAQLKRGGHGDLLQDGV